MSNEIYRGFEIEKAIIGGMFNGFTFTDKAGVIHGGFKTEEEAMNAIDAHKRELAKKAVSL